MREAAVLRTGKDERGQPELPHSTQTLNLTRLEQRRDDALGVALELDQAVNRIAENHNERLPRKNGRNHSVPAVFAIVGKGQRFAFAKSQFTSLSSHTLMKPPRSLR